MFYSHDSEFFLFLVFFFLSLRAHSSIRGDHGQESQFGTGSSPGPEIVSSDRGGLTLL